MSTRTLTLTAVLAAICCLLGPVTLPIGPVPLSLTTGVLMGMALILGARQACLCCGVYLMLGLLGVPVFSGFTGGLGTLLGPTGGFLLGYLPLTAWCGFACARTTDRRLQALALIAGTLLLYGIGGAWYAHLTGTSFAAALAVCMLPFLPGDALKMAAVITGGNAVKSRLQKAGLR